MGLKAVLDEVRWLTEETPDVLKPSGIVMSIGVNLPGAVQWTYSPAFQFLRTYLEEELGFKPAAVKGKISLLSPSGHVALSPQDHLSNNVLVVRLTYESPGMTPAMVETATLLVDKVFNIAKKLQSASVALKQVSLKVPTKYRSSMMKWLEDKLHLEAHLFEFAGLVASEKYDIIVVDKTNAETLKTLFGTAPMKGDEQVTLYSASGGFVTLLNWGEES